MTQDEMLAAIRKVVGQEQNDPGMSARQYAEAEGISVDAARLRLERKVELGLLIKGYAPVMQVTGRMVRTPVYRPAGT